MNTDMYRCLRPTEQKWGWWVGPFSQVYFTTDSHKCNWDHVSEGVLFIIHANQVMLRCDLVIRGADFLSKRGQSWSIFPQLTGSLGMNLGWHHIDSLVSAASVSESQDAGCLTSVAEVIMTNVKLRPADICGRPFPLIPSHLNLKRWWSFQWKQEATCDLVKCCIQ